MIQLTTHQVGLGIFYFAIAGSGIAALNHLLNPLAVLKNLTPSAITTTKDKEHISEGVEWWGQIAFSIMNLGCFASGIYAHMENSKAAKRAFMLQVFVLFAAFSLAWFVKGPITGKKAYKTQGIKVGLFALLFAYGFTILD